MQVSAVNNVRKSRYIEKEVEALQALSILEYNVVNNAKGGISKNDDVLRCTEKSVSQIE